MKKNYDEQHNPILSANGYAIKNTVYDDRGRVTYEETLDADGKLIIPPGAISAATGYQYNEYGPTERIFYGTDGQPMEYQGCAILRWEYNDDGRTIAWSYYDANDHLVIPENDNVAMLRRGFDQYGNVNYEATFGTEGEPINVRGYYAIEWEHDENGYLLSTSYLDENGKLMIPEDKEYARETWAYDTNGNWTEHAYYDQENKLTYCYDESYCAIRRTLDAAQNETECVLLGDDWKPIDDEYLAELGYAIVRYEYDSNGICTKASYYTGDNKPGSYYCSYHRKEQDYNPETREYTIRYYDTADKLICNEFGAYVLKVKVDEAGRTIRMAGFDADGNSMMAFDEYVTSFAVMEMEYDKNGNITRKAVFDPDGNPMMTAFALSVSTEGRLCFQDFSGYLSGGACAELTHYLQAASVAFEYDQYNRVVHVRLLNTRGEPVTAEDYLPYSEEADIHTPGIRDQFSDMKPFDALKASEISWQYTEKTVREVCKAADGIARTMREISRDTQMILIDARTDSSDQLLWADRDEPGCGERFRYSENAITIQLILTDGTPVRDETIGYAKMQIEYNDDWERQITAIRFYDENDQPVIANSVHRNEILLPGNELPSDLTLAAGCAAVECSDNQIIYYNPQGQLLFNAQQGFAIMRESREGGKKTTGYYDAQELPVLNQKVGFATKTEESGYTRFFDQFGQPYLNPVAGCAVIERTTDYYQPIQVRFYDTDGRPMINAVEGCAGYGGTSYITSADKMITTTYYGPDGVLMNNLFTGYAQYIHTSDDKDELWSFLDAEGKAVYQADAGYASMKIHTSETPEGILIKQTSYLDENGAPQMNPVVGYAQKLEYQYPENEMEESQTREVYLDDAGGQVIPIGLGGSCVEIKGINTETTPESYSYTAVLYSWTGPDGSARYSEADHGYGVNLLYTNVPYIDSMIKVLLNEDGNPCRYEYYAQQE